MNPWTVAAGGLVVAVLVLAAEWRLGIIGKRYRDES